MGGNALKLAKTRRYAADEYHALVQEISGMLERSGLFGRFHVTKAFASKSSFGDMDILFVRNPIYLGTTEFLHSAIEELFHPTEIFHNGSCTSFDYKELQIDLISTESQYWDAAKVYYGTSDLGNFMCRIADNIFGLRYGHHGLSLIVRDPENNQTFESLPVSTDPATIFTFLGFDWARFEQGFESMEEIFEFVVTSKYHDPSIYDYENLNHINRVRNRKREAYGKFLEYIAKFNVPSHGIRFTLDETLEMIKTTFGFDYKDHYYKTIQKAKDSRVVRKKVVAALRVIGYENKILGDKMAELEPWIAEHFDRLLIADDQDIWLPMSVFPGF